MRKNDNIKIEIEDTTLSGSGVGKKDGMAVFVNNAVEGDFVIAHIMKVKSNYAFAKIEKIIKPSCNRIESDCSSFQQCGGCVFRHIDYNKELEIKYNQVKSNFKKFYGEDIILNDIITDRRLCGYRNKAQLPLMLENDELKVGFYANHSHRVVDCKDCKLQPEIFGKIIEIIKKFVTEYGISVYDESNKKGLLRHVYIRKAEITSELMVVLVINGKDLPYHDALTEMLCNSIGKQLKSIQLNFNTKDTNVIMGTECKVIYGESYINDVLCGVKIRISPLSFYQVNHDMAEAVYKKAAEYAEPRNKTVLDLYCGAGTIGLSMANVAKQIIGVEIIEDAVKDAEFNAKENNFTNCRFICGDAGEAAEKLTAECIKPDVVLIDPPRKGCDSELITTIAKKFEPERIVYVSCDPATLARDCKLFLENGYKAVEATPVDLFPRTAHVETVALLSKLEVKQHIEIDLNMDELDLTAAESKATYDEIKAYVLKTTGLKVSHLNIAQVKRKYGIIERDNYNQPKSENSRQPQCTPEKEQAIKAALKHFDMIQDDKQ